VNRALSRVALFVVVLGLALLVPPPLRAGPAQPPAAGPRTLDDYRHFRAATIDLLGRMPTRDEIAGFERPDFDEDKWIDAQIGGASYVERLVRIYMDLLRLEPNVNFATAPTQLYRHAVDGPDGKPVYIYYREGQRRTNEVIDGEFCFTEEEVGFQVRARQPIKGEPKPKKVSRKLLDARTVLVRPWWLYRDYRAASPAQRIDEAWKDVDPEYRPVESLLTEPDGKQPTEEVRVCREEAIAEESGHVFASGRVKPPEKDAPLPKDRYRPAPLDKPFAVQHKGEAILCATKTALDSSADCGCGVGLERCVPGDGDVGNPNAFYFPNHMPLGPGQPLDSARQQAQRWYPHWWSREVVRYLGWLFEGDRDFREILTGKQTLVNGPLAQFHKSVQRSNCCGPEASFGMSEESEPLFDPKSVPDGLEPHDVGTWKLVSYRGPHAAGILTMPMFLEKYASARARGAVLYNAFLCKSFIADKTELPPSSEVNLMIRPGCSTCHATLEPLAAYFARVEPSNFVFLPQAQFPVSNTACKKDKNGKLNGSCNALYDVAFADDKSATLRSAYGSPQHADAAPAGAGHDIVAMPEFADCAVSRVTSSFLGRATTPDDDPLLKALASDFTHSGFKMKTLVKEILRSPTYRKANNLSSTTWRGAK
jgi:Protein of unknown function (DUF1585)